MKCPKEHDVLGCGVAGLVGGLLEGISKTKLGYILWRRVLVLLFLLLCFLNEGRGLRQAFFEME